MTTEFKDFEEVRERADELADWISESSSDLVGEQRQLEEGSREQAYWHYGYMVALRGRSAVHGGPRDSGG